MNPSTPAPRRFLLPKRAQQQQQQQQQQPATQTPQSTQGTPGGTIGGTPKFWTRGAGSSVVKPTPRGEIEDVDEGDVEMGDSEDGEKVVSSSVDDERDTRGDQVRQGWTERLGSSRPALRYGPEQDIEEVDAGVDTPDSPRDVDDRVISSSADIEEASRVRGGGLKGPFASSVVRLPSQRQPGRQIEEVEGMEDEESGMGEEEIVDSSHENEPFNTTGDGQRLELVDSNGEEEDEMDKGEVLVGMSSSPEVQRVAKRRRISVSPTSSPLGGPERRMLFREKLVESSDEEGDIGVGVGEVSTGDEVLKSQTTELEEEEDDDDGKEGDGSDDGHAWNSDDEVHKRTPKAQPTFRSAPRFKPPEEDLLTEGIPEAFFSPQRRGARYLPGGLAAELQGWLSDVRKWEDDDGARQSFKVRVEDVRRGGRGYLVSGVVVDGDGGQGKERGKFVLAGEGRLTGLGRGMDVKVGSLVEVGVVVWEVEVNEEGWTVSCDWGVVEG